MQIQVETKYYLYAEDVFTYVGTDQKTYVVNGHIDAGKGDCVNIDGFEVEIVNNQHIEKLSNPPIKMSELTVKAIRRC